MLRHLGYACICLSTDATCNKGTVLRNATPERLRALIDANLDGLRRILAFNIEAGVRLFRISSQIIPFGGHPVNEVPWWEEYRDTLAGLGALIRAQGLRVSMHPGQYTVLSSPDATVTENAIRDLIWHARFLDALGMDQSGKLVVHGGGAYGDRASASSRWVERYQALPENIRRRLVLEHDERVYSTLDVLAISDRCGVPVVIDTLHHAINPGRPDITLGDALRAAFTSWRPEDGPPKIHVSTQAEGLRTGAHADYIDPNEFLTVIRAAPDQPFDAMIEAKAKDLALFRLRDDLASRGIFETGQREAVA